MNYIHFMKAVGIRELKNRLSEYVRSVRKGEVVLVTDRGAVVAELRPPGATGNASSDPVVEAIARRGNVTIGAPNPGRCLSALRADRCTGDGSATAG